MQSTRDAWTPLPPELERVWPLFHAEIAVHRIDLAPVPGLRRRRADIVFTRALAVFLTGASACLSDSWDAAEHSTSTTELEAQANVAADRDTDARVTGGRSASGSMSLSEAIAIRNRHWSTDH
jgi:hypothetical protein